MTQHPTSSTLSGNPSVTGIVKQGARNGGPTKKAQLIQMLSRKAGADAATISEHFGWLPHTTRAALSGLRNSGYEVACEKLSNGKSSRYRITAKPAAGAA
jgi:DNA-binding IclR family transcriptional regulator